LGGIKFSPKGERRIVDEINNIISSYLGKRKKCLVLDLDNTLWGGVIGEDGIEGIELSEFKEGSRYKDFQKRLKEIKDLGVILTIVSKNNEDDVKQVFKNHKHMVLQENDFSIKKINWKSKPQNIEEISRELNIGLDSMVFIDDNPAERDLVRQTLPEVYVPEFPRDTSKLVDFMNEIYQKEFYAIRLTGEDLEKTNQYIQNAKRAELKSKVGSEKEFLKTLNTKIYIWKLREEDIARASQLSQKTNQFNLTTKRYTEKDFYNFLKSKDIDVYIASVEDKFGDNGKVVLVIISKDIKNRTAKIDTFLMSCRVMGRYIEDQIIDFIERKLRKENFENIISYYLPTKKNIPVKNLFDRLGYDVIEEKDGTKVYKFNLKNDDKKRNKFAELIEI
jgi:FkbH-like protein